MKIKTFFGIPIVVVRTEASGKDSPGTSLRLVAAS